MFMQQPEKNNKSNTNRWKKKSFFFQKMMIIMIMLSLLQTDVGFAEAIDNTGELQTVYHVYTDGNYIGDISKEESIEALKVRKLNKASSEFEQLSLAIGTDVSIVPERVFTAVSQDEQVISTLESQLYVHAEVATLVVNGEQVLSVKDEETLERVIRQFTLQSVSAEDLDKYEAQLLATDDLPEISEDETRIAKIIFSNELQVKNTKVQPSLVLTEEVAVEKLTSGGLQNRKHTIEAGETLESIAHKYKMEVSELVKLNEDYNAESTLSVGEAITVRKHAPYTEVEVHYHSKKSEEIPFEKVTEEDNTLLKGKTTIKQQGANGKKLVTAYTREKNGETLGKSLLEEEVVVEPKEEITVIGTKEIPSVGTGNFSWPAVGGYISSTMGERWGRMHEGIDIARPSSRSILASDNGVVVAAGAAGTYGNRIVIKHNNGYETLYAHLASISVQVGQVVPKGSKIGVMGNTGRSTGVHLHFEVRKNGALVNPITVLNR